MKNFSKFKLTTIAIISILLIMPIFSACNNSNSNNSDSSKTSSKSKDDELIGFWERTMDDGKKITMEIAKNKNVLNFAPTSQKYEWIDETRFAVGNKDGQGGIVFEVKQENSEIKLYQQSLLSDKKHEWIKTKK